MNIEERLQTIESLARQWAGLNARHSELVKRSNDIFYERVALHAPDWVNNDTALRAIVHLSLRDDVENQQVNDEIARVEKERNGVIVALERARLRLYESLLYRDGEISSAVASEMLGPMLMGNATGH